VMTSRFCRHAILEDDDDVVVLIRAGMALMISRPSDGDFRVLFLFLIGSGDRG